MCKEIRKKKRSEAYDNLQVAMPSMLGSFMGDSSNSAQLRAAIEFATEAGVSQVHIDDARVALRKMEQKEARGK